MMKEDEKPPIRATLRPNPNRKANPRPVTGARSRAGAAANLKKIPSSVSSRKPNPRSKRRGDRVNQIKMTYLLDSENPESAAVRPNQYGLVPLLSKTGPFWGEERVFYLEILLCSTFTHFWIRGKRKKPALFSPHPSGFSHGAWEPPSLRPSPELLIRREKNHTIFILRGPAKQN